MVAGCARSNNYRRNVYRKLGLTPLRFAFGVGPRAARGSLLSACSVRVGILVRACQVKRTAVISYRRLTQSLADTWAGSGGRWVKAGAVGLVRGKGIRMDVCSHGLPWMR